MTRNVRKIGDRIQVRFQIQKKMYEKVLKIRYTPENVRSVLNRLDQIKADIVESGFLRQAPEAPSERQWRLVFQAAKNRAKKHGRAYLLTKEQQRLLISRSKGRCSLTGIPFNVSKEGNDHKAPFAPSLDRINKIEGYTIDNCRLVCTAVNFALNEWGEKIFFRVADAYVKRQDQTGNELQ